MSRTKTVSDSVVVAADSMSLYSALSDPTRMGEWSPENRGATVTDARGEAYVGMEFVGRNKRGGARWVTLCTVTAADPGRRFAFRVHGIGAKTPSIKARNASWEYTFEPVDGGTRVTETWTDDRPWPDFAAAVFDRIVTRGSMFADFQRRNIAKTLKNVQGAFGPVSR
jgi:uncharacterized protein YndB with AHSA1/START domain